MDVIWDVKAPKKRKLIDTIKEKFGPFVVVSILGLLVIAWTAIANPLFRAIVFYSVNKQLTSVALGIFQIVLSFVVSTMLFALSYKTIPQAKVHWEDVGLAAVTTSIAFTVVNYILGSYIQTFTVTTVIGAAGSLMIILLWIYILNVIILFGAEISKTYALTHGKHSYVHLPVQAQKLIELLDKVEEIVEEEVKGKVEDIPGEKIETRESEELSEEPLVPPPKEEEEMHRQLSSTETFPVEGGVVEVSIKIKTTEKKQKSEKSSDQV